jgi:hypothetical protein
MSLSQQRHATVHVVMETLRKYIPPDVREAARADLHVALEKSDFLFTPIPKLSPEEEKAAALERQREWERSVEIVGTDFGL